MVWYVLLYENRQKVSLAAAARASIVAGKNTTISCFRSIDRDRAIRQRKVGHEGRTKHERTETDNRFCIGRYSTHRFRGAAHVHATCSLLYCLSLSRCRQIVEVTYSHVCVCRKTQTNARHPVLRSTASCCCGTRSAGCTCFWVACLFVFLT